MRKNQWGVITQRQLLYSTIGFCTAILIGISAFISAELAVILGGSSLIGGFLMFESSRRADWQRAFIKRLSLMDDKHEKLAREVNRNRNDISQIKDGITQTALTLEKQQTELEKAKISSAPAMRKVADTLKSLGRKPRSGSALSKDIQEREKNAMPRAEKPQRPISQKDIDKTAPPNIMFANDDPEFDASAMSDLVIKELVHHAVRERRIDVFVQPIMRLPQRKVRYYELFARIRAKPGSYLAARQYMHLAQQEKLMNDIDQMLLVHCLKTVKETAHLENPTPLFLNITTRTLKNKDFMSRLLAFLSKNRGLASRLVFEVQQQDFDDMHPAVLEILRGLGTLGCAFSLDHVTNLNFDLKFLQVLKVRFVKVDAKLLKQRLKTDSDYTAFWKVKRKIEGNGIALIIEKIETEDDLRQFLDFDLHYGQGYLFGKPDLEGAYRQRLAA